MPAVRKMTDDEVHALKRNGKGPRKLIEEQYDALLEGYEAGDYGEVALKEGDSRLTVRSRFKAAARRCGLSLDFKRTRGDLLRFKVVDKARA